MKTIIHLEVHFKDSKGELWESIEFTREFDNELMLTKDTYFSLGELSLSYISIKTIEYDLKHDLINVFLIDEVDDFTFTIEDKDFIRKEAESMNFIEYKG